MAVTFIAPWPQNTTTMILKNPEWNDTVNLKDEISVKRAINGTMYTYVKRQKSRRRLTMQFVLDSWKALEVEEFFRCYYAATLMVYDHIGNSWVGWAVNNPFEWTYDSKSGNQNNRAAARRLPGEKGRDELVSFTIELEVVPKGQEYDI